MSTLLAGLTVLVIGDSHLSTPGYLISTLHDALTLQGAAVYSYGACGVAAGDWMRKMQPPCGGAVRATTGPAKVLTGAAAMTTPLPDLVKAHRPNLVVVVMGDTMADYKHAAFSRSWIWQQVSSLTKGIKASGTSCVWVGPPWGGEGGKFGRTFARVNEMSNYLAEIVAPCVYVNSLELSKPGEWASFDGQHLTSAGYKSWGDAITGAIVSPAILPDIKR